MTLFVCANSGRPGVAPGAPPHTRVPPRPIDWPFPAEEIAVPCTGKIQPEHLLKAFETGADLVGVIACEAGNCHYLEGSRRAHRRIADVRGLLDEIGLGGARLLVFELPGSAQEDLAARTNPAEDGAARRQAVAERLRAIAEAIAGKLKVLGRSPLRGTPGGLNSGNGA